MVAVVDRLAGVTAAFGDHPSAVDKRESLLEFNTGPFDLDGKPLNVESQPLDFDGRVLEFSGEVLDPQGKLVNFDGALVGSNGDVPGRWPPAVGVSRCGFIPTWCTLWL